MIYYQTRGRELYSADYHNGPFTLVGVYPTEAEADREKIDRQASERIFSEIGGEEGRLAWKQLLRFALPEAKLCNCGEALYGCKYGCGWNQQRTKEVVAAIVLKKSKRE
jgi:hypothetical protein